MNLKKAYNLNFISFLVKKTYCKDKAGQGIVAKRILEFHFASILFEGTR